MPAGDGIKEFGEEEDVSARRPYLALDHTSSALAAAGEFGVSLFSSALMLARSPVSSMPLAVYLCIPGLLPVCASGYMLAPWNSYSQQFDTHGSDPAQRLIGMAGGRRDSWGLGHGVRVSTVPYPCSIRHEWALYGPVLRFHCFCCTSSLRECHHQCMLKYFW